MTLKPLLTNYSYIYYYSMFNNNYITFERNNIVYFEYEHYLDIYI